MTPFLCNEYWGYIGVIFGVYGDNGKEHGNYHLGSLGVRAKELGLMLWVSGDPEALHAVDGRHPAPSNMHKPRMFPGLRLPVEDGFCWQVAPRQDEPDASPA